MMQPISLVFRYLQGKTRVSIWLFDNADARMEGTIMGFDEFMNLVLDNAVEVSSKSGVHTPHGRILLKGDAITLITAAATGTALAEKSATALAGPAHDTSTSSVHKKECTTGDPAPSPAKRSAEKASITEVSDSKRRSARQSDVSDAEEIGLQIIPEETAGAHASLDPVATASETPDDGDILAESSARDKPPTESAVDGAKHRAAVRPGPRRSATSASESDMGASRATRRPSRRSDASEGELEPRLSVRQGEGSASGVAPKSPARRSTRKAQTSASEAEDPHVLQTGARRSGASASETEGTRSLRKRRRPSEASASESEEARAPRRRTGRSDASASETEARERRSSPRRASRRSQPDD